MTERRQFCPRGHDTFLVGRDSSHRCLACKRLAMRAAYAQRAEQERAEEAAIAAAEYAHARAEAERRAEREFRAAIEAGGEIATEARWHRAFTEAAESGSGLCQWAQDNDRPGGCFWRTSSVYCNRHGRQR